MHDQAIVELYWARDQSAIRQSDEKYGPYCRTIAHNVLHDPLDSEECVNDTWHRAWESMPPQRPNLLRAFFGTITRNLALNRWEKQHAQKRGGGQLPLALEELSACVPAPRGVEQAVEEVSEQAYDNFLKGNGQVLGIASYGACVDLLITYYLPRALPVPAAFEGT